MPEVQIANNRIVGALSWRTAKPVLLHPRFYDGFRDAMLGRPFAYQVLDGWPLLDQHRYENGRELAIELRSAGIVIRWPDRGRIPRELKLLAVGRAVARRPRPSPPSSARRTSRFNETAAEPA